ncbi:MAG: peptidyl-prolyl cis-trans isomerase [Clostridium sp.]|nr:MAG: peptidyl-prolyl cis-trans isomerase [Clostridium sp.]
MSDDEKKKAEEEALNKAKEVIKKLNDGADFAKLAKEYSDDSSNASKGGDLGYFNTGAMVEEFEKAAYQLKLNEYTKEPVKNKVWISYYLKNW